MSPIEGCIFVISKCEGECNCALKQPHLVGLEDSANVPEFCALDDVETKYVAADSDQPLLPESFGGSSPTPTNENDCLRSLIIMAEEMAKYADGATKLKLKLAVLDLEDHLWHLESYDFNDLRVVQLFYSECHK